MPTTISIIEIIRIVCIRSFINSCSNFYGINKRYFNETGMFEDKLIFLICAIVLLAYPFIFTYFSKKIMNKAGVVYTFILTIMILFVQNILYTISHMDLISYDCIKMFIGRKFTIIILGIGDIALAYFMTIRQSFRGNRKYNKIDSIILIISAIVVSLNIIIGITLTMTYDISDKRAYEVIENNKAIVSTYDEKFVVMDCKIQGDTLVLQKGSYSLEEMTGVPITCFESQRVICE